MTFTQNNTPTLPACLVRKIRKDATELSTFMYQAPKKKMLQEELKKMLRVWGGEKYDEDFDEDMDFQEYLSWDEDDGYEEGALYYEWVKMALDEPFEDPCIKRAAKAVGKGAGEEGDTFTDEAYASWKEAWQRKHGFI